ncbi:MAG: hypothetical protein KF767_06420 [Bdellovibrionaceae bacterium]|nr:hypothetical protein [Pseudobdellovibrionaceae bacterium]
MKSILVLTFCILSAALAGGKAPVAKGKTLQGYKRHMASTHLTYEGALVRYFDEGVNFFIQIEGQAGLYRFPKSADSSAELKTFLDDKLKSKKKIKLEVNAHTGEIVTLAE